MREGSINWPLSLLLLAGAVTGCAPAQILTERDSEPDPIKTYRDQIACSQDPYPRPYPPTDSQPYPDCDAGNYRTQQIEVCVNFVSDGQYTCIDPEDPVTPSTVVACPNDTIVWVGQGDTVAPFEVYFIPIRTGAGRPSQEKSRQSHGPWRVLPNVPAGKDAGNKNIEYKYTLVGGDKSCTGGTTFDPRIKVDPK